MEITINHHEARQGLKSLITLKDPVALKTGQVAKYLLGTLNHGYMYSGDSAREVAGIQVGEITDKCNHVVIPMSNVLCIQECNKVIKLEGLIEIQ